MSSTPRAPDPRAGLQGFAWLEREGHHGVEFAGVSLLVICLNRERQERIPGAFIRDTNEDDRICPRVNPSAGVELYLGVVDNKLAQHAAHDDQSNLCTKDHMEEIGARVDRGEANRDREGDE